MTRFRKLTNRGYSWRRINDEGPTKMNGRKRHSTGDIVAYRRRPRKGETLCHNHVLHTRWMSHGLNGFRWFVVDGRPGHGWKVLGSEF